MIDFFENLPEQIILQILKKLSAREVVKVSIQNKQLHALANCDSIWKDLVMSECQELEERKAILPQSLEVVINSNIDWQTRYQVLHLVPSYFFGVADWIHTLRTQPKSIESKYCACSMEAFSALTPIIQKFEQLLKKLPAFHCLLQDLYFWFESKPNVVLSCVEFVYPEDFQSSHLTRQKCKTLSAIWNAISILMEHNYFICPSLQDNLSRRNNHWRTGHYL